MAVSDTQRRWLQVGVIALACGWIYAPSIRGGWVWDDRLEVADNALIKGGGDSLAKIWTAPGSADYFPLKTSFQWLEWHLFGANTTGYHVTNVVLHGVGALLFWVVLTRLFSAGKDGEDRRQAEQAGWFGALFFAVHPLAVESVAWIAEFKNVLSLPLFLGAAWAFLKFEEMGRRWDFLLSLGLFLAAALCKTTVVMFPVVLLIYAWWRSGTVTRRDWARSAPFFAVSLVLGLVTVWFQEHRTAAGGFDGVWHRLAYVGPKLFFLSGKVLVPTGLSTLYSAPSLAGSPLGVGISWCAIAAILWASWIRRGSLGRNLLFGIAFFIVNLIPLLGVIPMAFSSIAWSADHFVYLPMLGYLGLGAGLFVHRSSSALRVAAGCAAAGLAIVAHRHAENFESNGAYWRQAAADNPFSWTANNNLGIALTEDGRPQEAVAVLQEAVRIRPKEADGYFNLGVALANAGRSDEALTAYERAVSLFPGFAKANNNLGVLLSKVGRQADALRSFEAAAAADPFYAPARNNLGLALARSGHAAEAIEQYQAALRADPNYADAWGNLGNAFAGAGRYSQAADSYQKALGCDPNLVMARVNLGNALLLLGRPQEARSAYERALAQDPSNAVARDNLERLRASGTRGAP